MGFNPVLSMRMDSLRLIVLLMLSIELSGIGDSPRTNLSNISTREVRATSMDLLVYYDETPQKIRMARSVLLAG